MSPLTSADVLKRGNAFDCSPSAAQHQQRFELHDRLGHSMHGAECGPTPTCRIRFWCSGGGGPPSGDVLLEEAIFKSQSEPPLLEWLSSGLLDILSRTGCCWTRRSQRGSFRRCEVGLSSGLRIQTARMGLGSLCGVRNSLLSNVTKSKTVILIAGCQAKTSAPLRSGMLQFCCWMLVWVHVYGDMNAPQMRFPETPQDQCLLHCQSETSQAQPH